MPAKTKSKATTTKTAEKKATKKVSASTKTAKSAAKKSPTKTAAVKKTTKSTAVASKTTAKKASTSETKKVSEKKVSSKKPTVTKAKAKAKVTEKAAAKKTTTKTAKAKTKTTTNTKAPAKSKTTKKGVKKIVMEKVEVKTLKPSSAGLYGVEPYIEKAGEEYMNEEQRAHFKEILHRWKRELMEEVDRTMHHMQDGVMRHPDPADSATQEEEFSLELRTRDRERKLIKKIDEALERIEQDDYGFCDACGIEIGIRRLEARPTAELCIDCKTMAEIKEKQTRL